MRNSSIPLVGVVIAVGAWATARQPGPSAAEVSRPGSTGDSFPTFELRPERVRYDSTMAPIGCVPVDINQDGALDVIVYYWGRSPRAARVGPAGNSGAEECAARSRAKLETGGSFVE